jgi:hypothetical protein
MGAQSDFIAEQFVPSERYKAQQMAMVQKLTAAGLNPEQLEKMFFIPVDRLTGEKPKEHQPQNQITPSSKADRMPRSTR